jgi:hypothetical protein
MIQDAFRTKWKFVVEFEDEATNEISGTIGQADTCEECEGMLEFDMQYHNSHGRIVLNVEAAEVCAKCEGEGKIAAMNGGLVICDACGGRRGPISKFDDFWPEWAGIPIDPSRRFLWSALPAAGGLTTIKIKSARMQITTFFSRFYEQLRSSDRFSPQTQGNG